MKRKPQMRNDKQSLQELQAEAEAALQLLDSETADDIIGEDTPEHRTLIRGTQAAMAMHYAMMKSLGLRETAQTLHRSSQTMAVMLTLVHYAYALGIRRGRAATGE
jgi:predicted sugar kinase